MGWCCSGLFLGRQHQCRRLKVTISGEVASLALISLHDFCVTTIPQCTQKRRFPYCCEKTEQRMGEVALKIPKVCLRWCLACYLTHRWKVVKFFITCANANANSSKSSCGFRACLVTKSSSRIQDFSLPKTTMMLLCIIFCLFAPWRKQSSCVNPDDVMIPSLIFTPIFWVDRWGKTKLSAPNLSLHFSRLTRLKCRKRFASQTML